MLRDKLGRGVALLITIVVLAVPAAAPADAITEGAQWTGNVGTFSELCPKDPEPGTNFFNCALLKPSASVNWGDGGTSTVTPTRATTTQHTCRSGTTQATCDFQVRGSYTWTNSGTYNVSASWSDSGNPNSNTNHGTVGFTATVDDAPIGLQDTTISRSGQQVTIGATLTDENPDAGPCDYDVEVTWGYDASNNPIQSRATVGGDPCIIFRPARAGAAVAQTSPPFTVSASRTYPDGVEPPVSISVSATDKGGQTATATFDVPGPPRATTGGANGVTQTSATLTGSADPQGSALQDCHFDWGTDTGYGHTAPCSPASFTGAQDVSAAISGLTPNTPYHFRLVMTTSAGTKTGSDIGFTTLATPAAGAPTVQTLTADGLTTTSATLHGVVNVHGGTGADCHFEAGTTTSYGQSVPCAPSPTGSSDVAVSAPLFQLAPDTTYHFRIVATNPGAAPSAGADATFTTPPRCDVVARFAYFDAQGCLAHSGSNYTTTPGSSLALDGLTLVPDDPTTTISLDTQNRVVETSAAVSVFASDVKLYHGKLQWKTDDPKGAASISAGNLTPPSGAKVAGMALDGDLALRLNSRHGADLTGKVKLPLASLASGAGIDGNIELHTELGTGLLHDQLKIKKDSFTVFGVGVKALEVDYSPSDDRWKGSAEVALPTPHKLDLKAGLGFQHGAFQSFSGAADNLNFQLIDGIYLQRISVVFGVNPTTVGGGLGLSFGPQVDGRALVRVDGDFVYQAATSTADGFIRVNGTLMLASFRVADAYFSYYTNGAVRFGGHFKLGLPDSSAADPSQQPVYIDTGFDGAVYQDKFDVDVKAKIALNFISLTLGAEILVSDKGLVACGEISAFGFTWNPGVGYTWATHQFDPFLDGCSVGQWKTLDLGAEASAAGRATQRIRLADGSTLLELHGSGGQPRVTLIGPHGQRVRVPTHTTKPLMVRGFMVFQDPAGHRTWIAIQHAGGAWRIRPEAGSAPVVRIRAAGILPAPRLKGRVTGKGAQRVLTWQGRRIRGERITFWEKGKGIARVVGSSTKTRGRLRFRPARGHAVQRTIVAHVTIDGRPRADLTIAKFKVPAKRKG